MYGHTSGYLSFQVKWTARCSAPISAHWEGFPLPFIQRCLRDVLGCYSCLSSSTCHSCRTLYQSPLPLSADHREVLITTRAGWEREGSTKGEGSMGIWTTSGDLPVTCTLRAGSGPTAYIPLPSDDEMLTCIPNFRAWGTRWHPTHAG